MEREVARGAQDIKMCVLVQGSSQLCTAHYLVFSAPELGPDCLQFSQPIPDLSLSYDHCWFVQETQSPFLSKNFKQILSLAWLASRNQEKSHITTVYNYIISISQLPTLTLCWRVIISALKRWSDLFVSFWRKPTAECLPYWQNKVVRWDLGWWMLQYRSTCAHGKRSALLHWSRS